MGLTNRFAVKNRFCQIHCVNVNSLYDLLLPFVKKKLNKNPHTCIHVRFYFVSFALGAMFYCNVQSIF